MKLKKKTEKLYEDIEKLLRSFNKDYTGYTYLIDTYRISSRKGGPITSPTPTLIPTPTPTLIPIPRRPTARTSPVESVPAIRILDPSGNVENAEEIINEDMYEERIRILIQQLKEDTIEFNRLINIE